MDTYDLQLYFCLIFCGTGKHLLKKEAVVVVIVWLLDLQLPVLSVTITTKDVSLNPVHGEVYLIQHYVINFVSYLRQVVDFLRALRFPPLIKLPAMIYN